MEKLEFLGIEFNKDQLVNWREHFDIVDDCDDLRLISKNVYEHCEDEGVFNKFKYRFVIVVFGPDNGMTIDDEIEGKVDAELYAAYIVPEMSYIHDSKVKSLQECYGLDDRTLEEVRNCLSEADFAQEGYGVCLGEQLIKATDKWNDDILNGFATALETVNSLLGFYLDRQVNLVGMTGWNFLEMALSEKDITHFLCRH